MANPALLVMDVQNGIVERLAEGSASLLASLGARRRLPAVLGCRSST
jgi:hypothetical protein